jgi:hypothetical protein
MVMTAPVCSSKVQLSFPLFQFTVTRQSPRPLYAARFVESLVVKNPEQG